VCRGARVAGPAREQGLEEHATVRVDLVVAGVEHDPDACDSVRERHGRRIDGAGCEVAPEDVVAGERPEVGPHDRCAREQAHGAHDAPLDREARRGAGAAHLVEMAPPCRTVGEVARVVAQAVEPQPIVARGCQRQAGAPPLPPGGGLRVGDQGPAAARARRGVEVERGEIRLGPLDESHGAVAAVVERSPEAVDRAVIGVGIKTLAPEALRGERAPGARQQRQADEQRARAASATPRARRDGPCPSTSPRCRRARRSARERTTRRRTRPACSPRNT